MKKVLVFLLIVLFSHSISTAQTLAQPAEPSDVCQEAWTKYQKADALWKTGWGLFGSGIGLSIAGGIMFPFGATKGPIGGKPKLSDVTICSLTFLGVGGGMIIASIPCLSVGQVRRKAALRTYKDNCSTEPPLTFSIQTSSDGIGLAMQF